MEIATRRWAGWLAMLLGFFFVMCSGVGAEEIRGTLAMPDTFVVPTTKVVLNGGQHTAFTARDGSFAFRDVMPGVYLLEVLSTTFHYSTVKIKVDDQTGIIAIEYKYPGAARKEVVHPLRLVAHAKWSHFEKKEGMKIGGMFKSPMTIIMILSFGLMFLLPKMMANLDPEQLEEIQGQQKAVAGAANMSFSDMLSNALAGPPPQQQTAGPGAAQSQRGGGSSRGGSGGGHRTKRSKG